MPVLPAVMRSARRTSKSTDQAVGIEDYMALRNHIEAGLDRDVEDYELEVTSTGLTSPFKTLRQYLKNIGNEVEVLKMTTAKQISKNVLAMNGYCISSC